MNEISSAVAHQEVRSHQSYTRWLTEEVFNLIDLVRRDEAIYNPRHKYYFCRPYVENFWREMDLRLRKNSGASLAKWTNLRISFRREYANYQEEKVPPCWSYFDRMLFLHPYLRNKKCSEPKVIDSHLQEAIAQIGNLNYKPHHQHHHTTSSEGSANEYMDQYLSYCEDEPQPSPEEIEEIIEEDTQTNSNNIILNDIKSESENEIEDKDNAQIREHNEYKDIIIEISDDPEQSPMQNELNQHTSPNDCAGGGGSAGIHRSLIKRPRMEVNSSILPSNNISLVKPLTMTTSSHSTDISMLQQSIVNSSHTNVLNRGEQQQQQQVSPGASAVRRSEFCECKTDSDAMFLMSLLPDIRKLNGRDRGKIKIAFQNIVQEFLYPD